MANRATTSPSAFSRSKHEMREDSLECIDACTACYRQCTVTLARVVEIGEPLAAPPLVEALLDCVRMCETSANFLLRGSEHQRRVCELCAEVCRACATACLARGKGELLLRCADACRFCADSCEQVAMKQT